MQSFVLGFIAFMTLFNCKQTTKITKNQKLKPISVAKSNKTKKVKWNLFKEPHGYFSVYSPEFRSNQTKKINTPEGEVNVNISYFGTGNNVYYISYNPRIIKEELKTSLILETKKRGILKKSKAKLFKEKDFKTGDYQGKELLIKKRNKYLLIKMYLTKNNFFNVVLNLKDKVLDEREKQFINSFKILKK